MPDFHSGAIGIPGSFTEGLFLRRSHRGYVRHWLDNVWAEYDRIKLIDTIGADATTDTDQKAQARAPKAPAEMNQKAQARA